MTIFISIASYRDLELPKTIKSLLDNADNPDELHFGVLSQDERKKHPDLSFVPNITYRQMHFKDAKGAGYARKIVMEMYSGEDYFFQIDSHMRFAKSWDTKLKNMFNKTQEFSGNKKIILSQFPAPYTIHTDGKEYYPKSDPDFWDEPSWTAVKNHYNGNWGGLRQKIEDKDRPHKSHTVLAGYVFTLGSFVKEVPYDERISFMGEELCLAIRAYTRGWDIYAPNEMLCWHFYKRKDRPKVWSNADNAAREEKWAEIELNSRIVQQSVLLGIEEGVYGIDDYDRYLEYQEMIGIEFDDFYSKQYVDKYQNSVLIQELDFSVKSGKLSGYCVTDRHIECLVKNCDCDCH